MQYIHVSEYAIGSKTRCSARTKLDIHSLPPAKVLEQSFSNLDTSMF